MHKLPWLTSSQKEMLFRLLGIMTKKNQALNLVIHDGKELSLDFRILLHYVWSRFSYCSFPYIVLVHATTTLNNYMTFFRNKLMKTISCNARHLHPVSCQAGKQILSWLSTRQMRKKCTCFSPKTFTLDLTSQPIKNWKCLKCPFLHSFPRLLLHLVVQFSKEATKGLFVYLLGAQDNSHRLYVHIFSPGHA